MGAVPIRLLPASEVPLTSLIGEDYSVTYTRIKITTFNRVFLHSCFKTGEKHNDRSNIVLVQFNHRFYGSLITQIAPYATLDCLFLSFTEVEREAVAHAARIATHLKIALSLSV